MSDEQTKRVILKADTLDATILPALGGKIASLKKNGIELLQQPLRSYAPRTLTMGFEESDASGFDECLPSVAACEIESPFGGIAIPDYGEFWRLQCEVDAHSSSAARLSATGTVLPLRLERTLRVTADTLHIDYRLENTGHSELHYIWSAHPLFAIDPGDRILLPSSVNEVQVEGSAHNRLGPRGGIQSWPAVTLADGSTADLSLAGEATDDTGDKVYAVAPTEGWCAIERREPGLLVRVEFDPTLSPYLGLWLCYGGWPEGRENRQNCVALEPCTGPADSLATAMAHGWAMSLAPGQSSSWWMRIETSVVS
jgi:hypothetical protein